MTKLNIPVYPFRSRTSLQIFWTAMAHNGTEEDGFQIVTSPAAAAINAFQAHTATGKLKARRHPVTQFRLYLLEELDAILAGASEPEATKPKRRKRRTKH